MRRSFSTSCCSGLGGAVPRSRVSGVGPPKPAPLPAPPPAAAKPVAPTPPPPPAPRAPAVVEFADEVVEVRRAAPPAAKAAAAPGPAPATNTGSRVLQFSKQAQGRGGVLGDDLGQMGGGMRAVLVLGALAAGGGILWFVMQCFS